MAKYVTDQDDGDEPNYDVEVMTVVAKNLEKYQYMVIKLIKEVLRP